MSKFNMFLLGLLIVLAVLALDFIIAAVAYKLICLCFGLTFCWKYAIGIWIIFLLVSQVIKGVKGDK